MGHNNSKCSVENNKDTAVGKAIPGSKNPFNRIWKPFKTTTAKAIIEPPCRNRNDENTALVVFADNQTQLKQKPQRNLFTPFAVIQTTINRIFTVKKISIVANNPKDALAYRSSPICHQMPVEKKSSHAQDIRNNNVFARPVTPEVASVHNETALMPDSTFLQSTICSKTAVKRRSSKELTASSIISDEAFPETTATTFPGTTATTFLRTTATAFPETTATSFPETTAVTFPETTATAFPTTATTFRGTTATSFAITSSAGSGRTSDNDKHQSLRPMGKTLKTASESNITKRPHGLLYHIQMATITPVKKEDSSSGNAATTSSSSTDKSPVHQKDARDQISPNTARQDPSSLLSSYPSSQSLERPKRHTIAPRQNGGNRGAKGEPHKSNCCATRVAPPAYLDYSTCSSSSGRNLGNSRRTGNPIIDRLKNVDVIEELKYFVPGQNCGGDSENKENSQDCDYYYVCDGCGEMEPAPSCPSQTQEAGDKTNPVTYSRRQRFNFQNEKNGTDDNEDDDGPPFKWPGDKPCCCSCCVAGLRRNPNCPCKCCMGKGRARVVNSFDEIPVGKNPEPRPRKECICDDGEDEDVQRCEELMPKVSGVYFYDAEANRFIRQVPRTPTPVVIQQPAQLQPPPEQQHCNLDMMEIIDCLPPRQRPQAPPKPIIMPPICGDNMNEIMANVELAMAGGGGPLMTCCLPLIDEVGGTQLFPMTQVSNQSPTVQSNGIAGTGTGTVQSTEKSGPTTTHQSNGSEANRSKSNKTSGDDTVQSKAASGSGDHKPSDRSGGRSGSGNKHSDRNDGFETYPVNATGGSGNNVSNGSDGSRNKSNRSGESRSIEFNENPIRGSRNNATEGASGSGNKSNRSDGSGNGAKETGLFLYNAPNERGGSFANGSGGSGNTKPNGISGNNKSTGSGASGNNKSKGSGGPGNNKSNGSGGSGNNKSNGSASGGPGNDKSNGSGGSGNNKHNENGSGGGSGAGNNGSNGSRTVKSNE